MITTEDFIEYASINDVNIHELYFGAILYEGTESCLTCHEDQGVNVLDTGHFKWEGKSENIAGLEGGTHGKNDLLNNFCIAVATNEARCTQCHTGYGYKDGNYNFDDPNNVSIAWCVTISPALTAKAKLRLECPDPSVDLNAGRP